MSSILTNTSALVALQTLKSSSAGLAKAQNEISTGMKVATAKDNSSSWAIAATMGSDVASYKKLGESLTSASAMVGVAELLVGGDVRAHRRGDRPGRAVVPGGGDLEAGRDLVLRLGEADAGALEGLEGDERAGVGQNAGHW